MERKERGVSKKGQYNIKKGHDSDKFRPKDFYLLIE